MMRRRALQNMCRLSVKHWERTSFTLSLVLASLAQPAAGQALTSPDGVKALALVLPTNNSALMYGKDSEFYQYTDRAIKPGFDLPWMGGRYGFVRNGVRTKWGILYRRFHEGVDIKPVARSSRGEPLDEVRSIADGVVVHTNRVSRHSSYGRYVVIEHWWHGSPYYSLYAHMSEVEAEQGQAVVQGERLGRMGYTGAGINKRRAHLHLEVNLLINRHFQPCYEEHFPGEENHHGPFNGLNMSGVDVTQLYLRLAEGSLLTLRQLVEETPGFFRVAVPAAGMLDILWRYPWLSPQLAGWEPDFGRPPDLAASWRITFSRSGLPVFIEASDAEVDSPTIEVLESTDIPYHYLTNGLVGGSGDQPELTRSGRRLVDFMLCPLPDFPDFLR